MSKLIRYPLDGRPCFVTSVTFGRQPILVDHSRAFLDELDSISMYSKSIISAWSLLPDHFHLIIDTMGETLSDVIKRFKIRIAHTIRVQLELNAMTLWQPRFWDHVIRDGSDYDRHLDYIHYNPVKHGYVLRPKDWDLSSYRKYLATGRYPEDWGVKEEIVIEGEFGE